MRVSEVMLPIVGPLLIKAAYFVLGSVSGEQPPEGVDLGIVLPARTNADAAAAAKETLTARNIPKLPITADTDFNEKTAPFDEACRAALELVPGILRKLSYAFGEGGSISKLEAGEVAPTLRSMARSCGDADDDSMLLAKTLLHIDTFMASYPDRRKNRVSHEVALLRALSITDRNLDRVGYLNRVAELIGLLDRSIAEMQNFANGLPDAKTTYYAGPLRTAVGFLLDAMKGRDTMIVLTRQITVLELALARATSKEERQQLAKKIADYRQDIEATRLGVRRLEAEAWAIIERAGIKEGLHVEQLARVAPGMRLP